MQVSFLILFSFFLGALPFSVWLGKLVLKQDVRDYADGNPGATNVFRAGNNYLGLLVLMLDISKAAAPVGWANAHLNLGLLPPFCISVAPMLGHAYSPFLKFRGGKALATVLGVWIGLTLWKVSIPAVLGAVIGIAIFTSAGWAVMLGLLFVLLTLLFWLPDPLFFAVWGFQVILLVWKHRDDLKQAPKFRSWVSKKSESGS